ncbi:MAG: LytR C-terminal domain-containing protein, partial [Calditrichia bacterium]|nr:LytR C-terminal domain-containing protein [Calditrichia bacterium]
KKYLENKGHTINSKDNYKSFRIKKSFIISQKKNDDPYILAKALNIPKSRIQIRKVKSSSNMIFVIGKDYKSLPPFKKQ